MSLRINDVAPNFTAMTTQGELDFHAWMGNSWTVFFSHPKDFTPVCTTELGAAAALTAEFSVRGTKVIGLSVDASESHALWALDIEEIGGHRVGFPIVGDTDLRIAKLYDMLQAEAGGSSTDRTAAMNAPVRTVFIIGPDQRIKLMMAYPMTTGRNFNEILRVLDSLQLTAIHKVATPANWQPGDKVIISGGVSNEEAEVAFPGFEAVKPYLRFTAQPR